MISKKDAVPAYTSTASTGPSRNEILGRYDLAPAASEKEAEMLRWEEAQAKRLAQTTPEGSMRVPLLELSPNPDNPRTMADADSDGLAASVAELGVIQALTIVTREAFVRHHPQHADTPLRRYVVIAGHRRWKAALASGRDDVPVMVADEAAENPLVWAVAENLQRVGLNPMEQARALRVLTDPPPTGRGMAQGEVARGIGKSQGFVSQRISLLRLVLELQQQVLEGTLKVKRGLLIAKLPAAEQVGAATALQRLAPPLQADIDGGRLTDVHEALRLAEEPAPRPKAVPTDSAPARQAPRQRAPQRHVRLGTPEEMADELARALAPDELRTLGQLLTERSEDPITQ